MGRLARASGLGLDGPKFGAGLALAHEIRRRHVGCHRLIDALYEALIVVADDELADGFGFLG